MRPKGSQKTPGSGRKKGSKNKSTIAREQMLKMLSSIKADDPMAFFDSIMRNTNAPYDQRVMAAKELMAFMHPKLSAIEARAGTKSHEDRLEELQQMLGNAPKQLIADGG